MPANFLAWAAVAHPATAVAVVIDRLAGLADMASVDLMNRWKDGGSARIGCATAPAASACQPVLGRSRPLRR